MERHLFLVFLFLFPVVSSAYETRSCKKGDHCSQMCEPFHDQERKIQDKKKECIRVEVRGLIPDGVNYNHYIGKCLLVTISRDVDNPACDVATFIKWSPKEYAIQGIEEDGYPFGGILKTVGPTPASKPPPSEHYQDMNYNVCSHLNRGTRYDTADFTKFVTKTCSTTNYNSKVTGLNFGRNDPKKLFPSMTVISTVDFVAGAYEGFQFVWCPFFPVGYMAFPKPKATDTPKEIEMRIFVEYTIDVGGGSIEVGTARSGSFKYNFAELHSGISNKGEDICFEEPLPAFDPKQHPSMSNYPDTTSKCCHINKQYSPSPRPPPRPTPHPNPTCPPGLHCSHMCIKFYENEPEISDKTKQCVQVEATGLIPPKGKIGNYIGKCVLVTISRDFEACTDAQFAASSPKKYALQGIDVDGYPLGGVITKAEPSLPNYNYQDIEDNICSHDHRGKYYDKMNLQKITGLTCPKFWLDSKTKDIDKDPMQQFPSMTEITPIGPFKKNVYEGIQLVWCPVFPAGAFPKYSIPNIEIEIHLEYTIDDGGVTKVGKARTGSFTYKFDDLTTATSNEGKKKCFDSIDPGFDSRDNPSMGDFPDLSSACCTSNPLYFRPLPRPPPHPNPDCPAGLHCSHMCVKFNQKEPKILDKTKQCIQVEVTGIIPPTGQVDSYLGKCLLATISRDIEKCKPGDFEKSSPVSYAIQGIDKDGYPFGGVIAKIGSSSSYYQGIQDTICEHEGRGKYYDKKDLKEFKDTNCPRTFLYSQTKGLDRDPMKRFPRMTELVPSGPFQENAYEGIQVMWCPFFPDGPAYPAYSIAGIEMEILVEYAIDDGGTKKIGSARTGSFMYKFDVLTTATTNLGKKKCFDAASAGFDAKQNPSMSDPDLSSTCCPITPSYFLTPSPRPVPHPRPSSNCPSATGLHCSQMCKKFREDKAQILEKSKQCIQVEATGLIPPVGDINSHIGKCILVTISRDTSNVECVTDSFFKYSPRQYAIQGIDSNGNPFGGILKVKTGTASSNHDYEDIENKICQHEGRGKLYDTVDIQTFTREKCPESNLPSQIKDPSKEFPLTAIVTPTGLFQEGKYEGLQVVWCPFSPTGSFPKPSINEIKMEILLEYTIDDGGTIKVGTARTGSFTYKFDVLSTATANQGKKKCFDLVTPAFDPRENPSMNNYPDLSSTCCQINPNYWAKPDPPTSTLPPIVIEPPTKVTVPPTTPPKKEKRESIVEKFFKDCNAKESKATKKCVPGIYEKDPPKDNQHQIEKELCTPGQSCEVVLAYGGKVTSEDMKQENEIILELLGESLYWIAVGFSQDDRKMGNDFVTECVAEPNDKDPKNKEIQLYNSWNYRDDSQIRPSKRYKNERIRDKVFIRQKNARLIKSQREELDGKTYIYCRFAIKKRFQYEFKGPGDPEKVTHAYTLHQNPVFIIYALGIKQNLGENFRTIEGNLNYHGSKRFFTNNRTTLGVKFYPSDKQKELLKTHGQIMYIVWIFFFPISTFIARYYKETLRKYAFRGSKLWLIVHVSFSGTALFLLFAGYFVLSKAKEDWQLVGGVQGNFHLYAGITCSSLTFTNMYGGIFMSERIKEEKWHIVEFIHGMIGHVAFLSAFVAIYNSESVLFSGVPCGTKYILWLWIIVYFAFHLVMSYHHCWIDWIHEKEGRAWCFTVRAFFPAYDPRGENDAPGVRARLWILLAFVIFSVIILISTAVNLATTVDEQSCLNLADKDAYKQNKL